MAKRDPELTARNRTIKDLSQQLKSLLPDVLEKTGFYNEHSLHGKIGGKFDEFIDIMNEVIVSPQHFISLWLEGYERELKTKGIYTDGSAIYETYQLLRKHKVFKDYLFLFLERTYWRQFGALSKKRPTNDEAEIYIGQNNADYGILVTPRFRNGVWENDKSEIRRFNRKYWTIGHIIKTGLVVPHDKDRIEFKTVEEYLIFFKNVLVRNSGSSHEKKIAQLYCDYVKTHNDPESIPLLIPELRYEGIDVKHEHRLDFTIIEPVTLNKIGFELSPWSTHGQLKKIGGKSQKAINDIAQENFEKEMAKHKKYYKKHGIFSLIYTDMDLKDPQEIFADMLKYLEPKTSAKQLRLHVFDNFFKDDVTKAK